MGDVRWPGFGGNYETTAVLYPDETLAIQEHFGPESTTQNDRAIQ